MRVTRHEHVYQLTWFPGLFPVNVYLVEEEKELTLIDAGLPLSLKGILKTAAELGKPITHIVLTHAHDDHVGSLDALKEALPEAEVSISQRDAKLLRGDRSLEPGEPATPIRGGVPKSVKSVPDRLLRDGDRIGSLLAIAAPGHTPGLMAFLDTRNRALIAGDAFQTQGGVAVSGKMKLRFPFPAFATWNLGESIASARKLRALEPSLLAAGHGPMLQHPAAAIDKAIQEADNVWRNQHHAKEIH